MKNREAQHLIQWNLLMADKESDISCLMDQRELDILAESEGSLAELSRDITATSQQIKVGKMMMTCAWSDLPLTSL